MKLLNRQTFIVLALLSCLLCGTAIGTDAQVNVTANQTALALAQKLAGPGITVLNPTLVCPNNANGFFSVVTSNLGLDSGIVLTTGRAATSGSSYGINGTASVNASINNNAPGDPQLATLARSTTFDACRLEFDLIPKGDTISFDYVFGSEEYNTSTCGNYNDAFAFFISGPGITGQQNIALVPGTVIPVAVNSINGGVPGAQGNISNCTSMGAGSPFTSYFVNNAAGTTITYRGFTTVLRASSAVQACSTYHLKMTIADAGNGLFDSGVFIRAGSLKTNTYTIHADSTPGSPKPFVVKGCLPGTITVKRSATASRDQTIKYLIAGTAVNGTDYARIADSVVISARDSIARITISGLTTGPTGTKTIKLYLLSPYSCNGVEVIDSTTLDIVDGIVSNINNNDTSICAGNAVAFSVTGSNTLSYSWSPTAGLNNPSIKEPVAAPATTTPYILTTTYPNSGCAPKLDTVVITVHSLPVIEAGTDQASCEGSTIQLNATITVAETSSVYRWSGPNGFTSNVLNPSIPATMSNTGMYVFTINSDYCPEVKDSLQLSISDPPLAPSVISPLSLCLNSIPQAISARSNANNLVWYTAADGGNGSATAPIPATSATGVTHYYVATRVQQCESARVPIEVIVEKCCGDNVYIPSAFTPNGDGRNDRFNIHVGEDDVVLESRVFNRWGQLVFQGRRNETWDGTFQGQLVELGTYYYHVLINCKSGSQLERKGEVIVVR